jgi:ATP-binding cassette subfamily F protein 3
MSGGEKARLVLALIVLEKPQLLLLDEPTNHLDLEMRQALVMALQEFNGAIILIAHDRYLLESCVDEFYLIANGQLQQFSGDIDDYQQWLNDDKKQLLNNDKTINSNVVDKKSQRQQQAQLRKKTAPLRKKSQQIEQNTQQWQQQLAELELQLNDTDLYQSANKEKLTLALKQQAKLTQDIADSEMHWLELEEQIEQIMNQ